MRFWMKIKTYRMISGVAWWWLGLISSTYDETVLIKSLNQFELSFWTRTSVLPNNKLVLTGVRVITSLPDKTDNPNDDKLQQQKAHSNETSYYYGR